MGAGQSDLYKGTYGDNIDNIPDEANPEVNCTSMKSAVDSSINNLYLTDSQKSTIQTLENTIKDHLTEDDFSGTKLELEGRPIVGKLGTPFQHLYEMKTSYKTLIKVVKSLEGTLQNPNLGGNERSLLQQSLDRALNYIERITALLSKYGEL